MRKEVRTSDSPVTLFTHCRCRRAGARECRARTLAPVALFPSVYPSPFLVPNHMRTSAVAAAAAAGVLTIASGNAHPSSNTAVPPVPGKTHVGTRGAAEFMEESGVRVAKRLKSSRPRPTDLTQPLYCFPARLTSPFCTPCASCTCHFALDLTICRLLSGSKYQHVPGSVQGR